MSLEDRKYKCYHYGSGSGYGSHSSCGVYGYFRCHIPEDEKRGCKHFMSKDDTKGIERLNMRIYVHEIVEFRVEIEDKLKSIKTRTDYILEHL